MKIINCVTLGEMCEAALDGEPVFVLRAQDQLALDTVRHYLKLAEECKGKNIGRINRAIEEMSVWRSKNQAKLKVPD